MSRQNIRELVMALYGEGDTAARVDAVSRLVVDLLVEVEALRDALIQLSSETRGSCVHAGCDIPCHDGTLTEGKGVYQAGYVNAAYVLHNSAGPTGGVEKLLGRFYPIGVTGSGMLRESLMLQRLGFSEEEIDRFQDAVGEAEQFT